MEVVEGGTILSNKDYYELEYINFMIEVLKPFIEFQRVSSRGCSVGSVDQIRIYFKKSGIIKSNAATAIEAPETIS